MAKMGKRGEKRRCQSEHCAASFYDLNRDTFACPNCGTVFDLTADAAAKAVLRKGSGFGGRKKVRELQMAAPGKGQPAVNDNNEEATAEDAQSDDLPIDDGDTEADKIILDEEDDDDALPDALALSEADNDDTR